MIETIIQVAATYSRELVLLLCALAGVVMVVGSIVLLRAGAMKITQDKPTDEAVTLQVLDFLKLQTRYPALGIFIVALAFFVVALYSSRPADPPPVRLTGKIVGPEAADLTIKVEPLYWSTVSKSEGVLDAVIRPRLEMVYVSVTATGWRPASLTRPVSADQLTRGSVDLGEFKFQSRVAAMPKQDKRTIVPADGGVFPPLNQPTGGFGR